MGNPATEKAASQELDPSFLTQSEELRIYYVDLLLKKASGGRIEEVAMEAAREALAICMGAEIYKNPAQQEQILRTVCTLFPVGVGNREKVVGNLAMAVIAFLSAEIEKERASGKPSAVKAVTRARGRARKVVGRDNGKVTLQ